MPDKPKPDLLVIAYCRKCGEVVAAHVISKHRDYSQDIGNLVQQYAFTHRVELVWGPVTLGPCICAA